MAISPSVRSKFVTKTLVFKHLGLSKTACNRESLGGGEWLLVDRWIIRSLFVGDPRLFHRFQLFLGAGCCGIVLVRDGRWVAYDWCAQPESGNPPHLPAWVRVLRTYWIFYCHTRESFRRCGLYKDLLRRFLALARERHPGTPIYADAYPENSASRRAILSAGFSPCGKFTTYKLWVPRVANLIVSGFWAREEPHPSVCARDAVCQ